MNTSSATYCPKGALSLPCDDSSPLHAALGWWISRDTMGGFATAGAILFPGWTPRRSCRAPHREDRSASFSLYRNRTGQWRFKDHATSEQGGLVAFVMLAGMDGSAAARWLMEKAFTAETPRRGEETAFRKPPRLCVSAVQYTLSDSELHRCRSMSASLAGESVACVRFASARNWNARLIHALALQGSLGLHEFQRDIRVALDDFKPDCVILDPWNSAARDDKQRDYSETFDALRALLPKGVDKPALGIVAHTRKPQPAEKRTGGTGLMHILAGSHVLTSVPRCVFVMTRASEEESDDRVVWFNPKNNNGELMQRTAWRRGSCGFEAVGDFDWEAFDKAADPGAPQKVTIDHLREVFESCDTMELSDAVNRLMIIAGVSQSTVYRVLSEGGQFAANLTRNGRMLAFKE